MKQAAKLRKKLFKRRALAFLLIFGDLNCGRRFTSEQVIRIAENCDIRPPKGKDNRSWGSVFREAQRRGLITRGEGWGVRYNGCPAPVWVF
jgi:hypothetical protein